MNSCVRTCTTRLVILVAAATPCFAGTAFADSADDEAMPTLTVTGEFRPRDVLQLPGSQSVVTDGDIEARQAQHLGQVLAMTPNVNYAGGTSRARYFQIRGVGERSEYARPLISSVGVVVDGVDFSGIGSAATLHDVQQVEVFRGPQGTRYGATGLAGVINVVTREPVPVFDAGVTARAGNYNSFGLGGFVSGPISSDLSYRLSAEQYTSDGFIRNDFLRRNDTDNVDERTLRGKLRWQPDADTTIDVMLSHINVDNGFDTFSLDNNRRTLSDEPGHDRQRSNVGSVRAHWGGSDRFAVEMLAAHADSRVDYGYDEDWTFDGFHPSGYSAFDNYLRDHARSTVEVRLLSNEAGRLFADSTQWVAGAYWLDQSVDFRQDYTYFSAPFESRHDLRREALFGQTESALTEVATLTLGVRYERHRARYADTGGVVSPSDNLFGAHAAIDYLLGRNNLVYASLARGYKVGGFNIDGSLDEDLRRFDPEILYNYELGLKGSWADDAVQGRIALFYMRREDAQLSTSSSRPRDDGSTAFLQYTDNTGSGSDNYGLEAELQWRPTSALTLTGALGLLEARYGDFINADDVDLSGRRQAHAPRYQFHGAAQYRFGSGIWLRAEVEGRDEFFFSDGHSESSERYELAHLTLGWMLDNVTVELWARNIFDTDHAVRGFFFGNDPRTGWEPNAYVQLGEPRRLGITGSWRLR